MPTLRPRKGADKAPAATLSSDSTATTRTPVSNASSTARASPDTLSKRAPRSTGDGKQAAVAAMNDTALPDEETRLISDDPSERGGAGLAPAVPTSRSWAQRNQWIVLALASGACAAFNGVFAKLTTTELTTKFSSGIAHMLGLESAEGVIELIVRGSFFGLNLAFNGVMWTLFTAALARGNSTTQVSIMNTSTNFVITAILGFVIFSEALPPLWWVGAALLVAGNVIIGRKDEGTPKAQEEEEGVGAASLGSEVESQLGGGRRQGRGGEVSGEDGEEYKDEDVADLRI
ncbi:hypothetical protein VTG60DRAFT_42 [Thermothelomyces hinnuleus]